MKQWSIRLGLLLLCVCVLCGAALAGGELTLDITYLPVEGEGFVVDSLYGVPALYNETGPVLYCSELVERFYAEAYGVRVCASNGPVVTGSRACWFEVTDEPMTGDVAYASSAARERDCGHYALVKYADQANGTVTLIEQNWGWNGCAGFNRMISYDGACYTFYRLCDKNGWVQPKQENTVSFWAQEYLKQAQEYGITDGLLASYRRPATREQIARLAINTLGCFGIHAWSSDPCKAACELRIMSVDTEDNFHPGQSVSREMAATVLARVYALIGELPEQSLSVLDAYADRSEISDWAAQSVAAMTQMGLMTGTGAGFAPKQAMTTEQVIAVMVRMIQTKK